MGNDGLWSKWGVDGSLPDEGHEPAAREATAQNRMLAGTEDAPLNRCEADERIAELEEAERLLTETALWLVQHIRNHERIIREQKWVLGLFLVFTGLWFWLVGDPELVWVHNIVSGCVTFYFTSRLLQLARMNRERKART